MTSIDETDDAQRRLEQQALRNVRDLVDKLEHEDRPARALVAGLIALVVVVAAIGVLWWTLSGPSSGIPTPAAWLPAGTSGSTRVFEVQSAATPAVKKFDLQRMENPRRVYVGSKPSPPLSDYVAAFEKQVTTYAVANPVRTVGGMKAVVAFSVDIWSDGSLGTVKIDRQSGNPALDQAAINFVRDAAPYPAFKDFGIEGVDVLTISLTLTYPGRKSER